MLRAQGVGPGRSGRLDTQQGVLEGLPAGGRRPWVQSGERYGVDGTFGDDQCVAAVRGDVDEDHGARSGRGAQFPFVPLPHRPQQAEFRVFGADPRGQLPPFGGESLPLVGLSISHAPLARGSFVEEPLIAAVGGRVEGVPEFFEAVGEVRGRFSEPSEIAVRVEGVGEQHPSGLFEQSDRQTGAAAANRARGCRGAEPDGPAQQQLLVVADEMARCDGVQQVDRRRVAVQGAGPVTELSPDLAPRPCGVQALGGGALRFQGCFAEGLGRLDQIGPTPTAQRPPVPEDGAEVGQSQRPQRVAGWCDLDRPAEQRHRLTPSGRRPQVSRAQEPRVRGHRQGTR